MPFTRASCLDDWDYRQDTDSAGAAYYNAVWRHLLAGLFHDELTGDLRPDGGDRWFEVMQVILADRQGIWWDDVQHPRCSRAAG